MSWFKNIRVFRIDAEWQMNAAQLSTLLAPFAFEAGRPTEEINLGWVPIIPDAGLVHSLGGKQLFLALRAEKKLLPASVVKQHVAEKAEALEETQGYRPGRKQIQEIREEVTQFLRGKAFSIFRDTQVWIDLEAGLFVVNSASDARVDEVLGFFSKAVAPLPLFVIETEISPISWMNQCLLGEVPDAFTVDQDAELVDVNGDARAKIKYTHHPLEQAQIAQHLEQGKVCTQLAMTWAEKISFVLSDKGLIKRITPLDILPDSTDAMELDPIEAFDNNMTLMTSELRLMIQDIFGALGAKEEAE